VSSKSTRIDSCSSRLISPTSKLAASAGLVMVGFSSGDSTSNRRPNSKRGFELCDLAPPAPSPLAVRWSSAGRPPALYFPTALRQNHDVFAGGAYAQDDGISSAVETEDRRHAQPLARSLSSSARRWMRGHISSIVSCSVALGPTVQVGPEPCGRPVCPYAINPMMSAETARHGEVVIPHGEIASTSVAPTAV